MTAIVTAPVEHVGATDTTTVLPPARRERYTGQHRDPRQAAWRPAHTRAAVRRRAQHARPAGQRPDLRIEKTEGLTVERLQQILAVGGGQ